MAKDAKGHGSERHGGVPVHGPDDVDRLARQGTPRRGASAAALDRAERGELGSLHSSNQDAAAASELAGGHPKAVAAPTHSSMRSPDPDFDNDPDFDWPPNK